MAAAPLPGKYPDALALTAYLWHNTGNMSRWIGFILAIIIGAVLGLAYGWVVNPVKYVDTSPDSLRIDYKSDYVLMVSETYQAEKKLDQAANSLAFLGDGDAATIVHQALLFAQKQGYSDNDLTLMQTLENALRSRNPSLGGAAP